MAKEKKERAGTYEEKLAINGSFEDVIKASVTPKRPLKYRSGDTVLFGKDRVPHTVIETKEEQGGGWKWSGFDYILQKPGEVDYIKAFEEDIDLE